MLSRTAVALIITPMIAAAQDAPSRLSVRVSANATPIVQAHVIVEDQTVATNAAGIARVWLKRGPHLVVIRAPGYRTDSLRVTMSPRDTLIAVELRPAVYELSEDFFLSAEDLRRLKGEPARVEVIGRDEVVERTEMHPQDLKGFFTGMTGVQVQTTSAGTGAAGARLQGLKSRYSLLLVDGLPLYGSGGNGLDLLQLPSAGLEQVEVVKGPMSASHGANALGGTINFVSKRPGNEADVLVHGNSEMGGNAFGWVSKRKSERFGYTALLGLHRTDPRDGDGDTWLEIPRTQRFELRPRFFFDSPGGGSAFLTLGVTGEDREGGFRNGDGPGPVLYSENAQTARGDIGFTGSHVVGENGVLQARSSWSWTRMDRDVVNAKDITTRNTGLGEVSYSLTQPDNHLLVGAALQADKALTTGPTSSSLFGRPVSYTFVTPALFVQDYWSPMEKVSLIASGRADVHSEYGTFLSPRLSVLFKPIEDWYLRLAAARGFFAPTPFIEEADLLGPHSINGFRSADPRTLKAETADYGSADLHGTVGPLDLNATLFASVVHGPVIAVAAPGGRIDLFNSIFGHSARGLELLGVYDLDPLVITARYTYTDARERGDITSEVEVAAPYTPRHTGGIDLTWDDAKRGTRVALESFFRSRQRLVDDPTFEVSKPYAITGVLLSQKFGRYKVFANVENLTDVRQTNFAPLVRTLEGRSAEGHPWIVTPWAPLEGRTFSIGLRIHSGGEK